MSRLNSRSLYATPINMGAVSESDEQTAYSQVLLNNRDCSSTTDVKHKMPVTVGLSIKWNITREWALETGMNYTMLSSELHSGSGSYIEEQQKLHYIGIPLKYIAQYGIIVGFHFMHQPVEWLKNVYQEVWMLYM